MLHFTSNQKVRSGCAFTLATFTANILLSVGVADDTARRDKLDQLVEAQGYRDILEEQIEGGKNRTRQIHEQSMTQIRAELDPDKVDYLNRAIQAGDRFLEACEPLWNIDEWLRKWTDSYGESLTDSEIDSILAFYQSPAGRKDIEAGRAALQAWRGWVIERQQDILQPALNELNYELSKIRADMMMQKDSVTNGGG